MKEKKLLLEQPAGGETKTASQRGSQSLKDLQDASNLLRKTQKGSRARRNRKRTEEKAKRRVKEIRKRFKNVDRDGDLFTGGGVDTSKRISPVATLNMGARMLAEMSSDALKNAVAGLEQRFPKADQDKLRVGQTQDTAQYPDKMGAYTEYLDAQHALTNAPEQTQALINRRESAEEFLKSLLTDEETNRYTMDADTTGEFSLYEAPPTGGMEGDEWLAYKVALLVGFSEDVLQVSKEKAQDEHGITLDIAPGSSSGVQADTGEVQPGRFGDSGGLEPLQRPDLTGDGNPDRTFPTLEELDQTHKEMIKKSLKESGQFDDDCFADFDENYKDYVAMSAVWALFATTLHDIVAEIPKRIQSYSKKAAQIHELHRSAVADAKNVNRVKLEKKIGDLKKKLDPDLEKDAAKLKKAEAKLRKLAGANPKTSIGMMLKLASQHCLIAVTEALVYLGNITGFYGNYGAMGRLAGRARGIWNPDFTADAMEKRAKARGRKYSAFQDGLDTIWGAKKAVFSIGALGAFFGAASLKKSVDAHFDDEVMRKRYGADGVSKKQASSDMIKLMNYLDSLPTEKRKEARDQVFKSGGLVIPADQKKGRRAHKIDFSKETGNKQAPEKESFDFLKESLDLERSYWTQFELYINQVLTTLAIIDLTPELLLPNYYMFDFRRDCANAISIPLGLMAAFPVSSLYRRHKAARTDILRGQDPSSLVKNDFDTIRSQYVQDIKEGLIRSLGQSGEEIADLAARVDAIPLTLSKLPLESLEAIIIETVHKVESIIFHENILGLKVSGRSAAEVTQEIHRAIDKIVEEMAKRGDLSDFRRIVKEAFPDIPDTQLEIHYKQLLKQRAKAAADIVNKQYNRKYKATKKLLDDTQDNLSRSTNASKAARAELDSLGSANRAIGGATLDGPAAPSSSIIEDTVEATRAVSQPRSDAVPTPPLLGSQIDIDDYFADAGGAVSGAPRKPRRGPPSRPDISTERIHMDDAYLKQYLVEDAIDLDDLNSNTVKNLDEAAEEVVEAKVKPLVDGDYIDLKLYHDMITLDGNEKLFKNVVDKFKKRLNAERADGAVPKGAPTAEDLAKEYIETLELIKRMVNNNLDPNLGINIEQIFQKITIPQRFQKVFYFLKDSKIFDDVTGRKQRIKISVDDFIEKQLNNALSDLEKGIPISDGAIDAINGIRSDIRKLVKIEANKLSVIPSKANAAAFAKWVNDIPLLITKVVVFCFIIEKLFDVGKFVFYDLPGFNQCDEIKEKISKMQGDGKVTEDDLMTYIECSIKQNIVFNSRVIDTSMKGAQGVTEFFGDMLAVRFLGADARERVLNKRAKLQRKRLKKGEKSSRERYWMGSFMRDFLTPYPGNEEVKNDKKSINVSDQYHRTKILCANFIFNKPVQNALIEGMKNATNKDNTIADLEKYRREKTPNDRSKIIYLQIQSAFKEINSNSNFLNNFIQAMGPHQPPGDDDPVQTWKSSGKNYNFLNKLSNEDRNSAIEQIRLVVLIILQASDVDRKIDDNIDTLIKKSKNKAKSSDSIIADAVEMTFQEITDPNSGMVPDWADEDGEVTIMSQSKDNDGRRLYIRRPVQEFEQSKFYEKLSEMDLNITNSLTKEKIDQADSVQENLELKEFARKDLSNMVRNMLLEFSYGQGYSPYPYHSDIGEEQEEAPDFMQDWKDFELSLVRDESRNTAIEVAKILVKDLELFGDVVDLVGKNQSVATEILKNLKKKK